MDMDIDGINSEKIAILDAGAQYSKLIDRYNETMSFSLDHTIIILKASTGAECGDGAAAAGHGGLLAAGGGLPRHHHLGRPRQRLQPGRAQIRCRHLQDQHPRLGYSYSLYLFYFLKNAFLLQAFVMACR